jgi:hypothetical protein
MKPPSSILSAVRTLTVSKDALKKLSKAAIDFDVRPHELIDAIVVYTNWEVQVGKLADIIRKTREKSGVVSESRRSRIPSLSPSLTENGVLTEPSPSPGENVKTPEKTRKDSVGVDTESTESLGGTKT